MEEDGHGGRGGRAYLEPPKRYLGGRVSSGAGFMVGVGEVWEKNGAAEDVLRYVYV